MTKKPTTQSVTNDADGSKEVIKAQKADFSQLMQQIKDLEKECDLMDKRELDLLSKNDSLEREVSLMKSKIKGYDQSLMEVRDRWNACRQRINSLESENRELGDEIRLIRQRESKIRRVNHLYFAAILIFAALLITALVLRWNDKVKAVKAPEPKRYPIHIDPSGMRDSYDVDSVVNGYAYRDGMKLKLNEYDGVSFNVGD